MVFEVDADAISFHDEVGVAQVEFDAECGIAIGDIEAFVIEFCTVGRTETFTDGDEVRATDGDVFFEEEEGCTIESAIAFVEKARIDVCIVEITAKRNCFIEGKNAADELFDAEPEIRPAIIVLGRRDRR